MNSIIKFTAACVAIAISTTASTANAAFFTGLGDLPGGDFFSIPKDVSADGSVVVGWSRSTSGTEAFRWTSDGGMQGLGDLPGRDFYSEGQGISADGTIIVGRSYSDNETEPFRWTHGSGMVGLGHLPGGRNPTWAEEISADGSVIIGWATGSAGPEAFRWTSDNGMFGLGDLPGGSFSSTAFGVSANGSVIVGRSASTFGLEAFRWTIGGGMIGLGGLTAPIFRSEAWDVSEDGTVVVGDSTTINGQEAFRWTSDVGMVGLGDLPGGQCLSIAYAVSADGTIIVGISESASGNNAFIWDSANGMRNLRDVLVDQFGLGDSLIGWRLMSAEGISADGQTIIGHSLNPRGEPEAWLANLRPNPVFGDTNGDNRISLDDLNNVHNHFGDTGPADGTLAGDAYPFDGQVNVDDLNAVLNNYGVTSAAPVPEPGSLVIASWAALAGLLSWRGKRLCRAVRRSWATWLCCWLTFAGVGQASGQFTTVLNVPPDPNISNNQTIGSNTQLNLFDGGVIGSNLRAGEPAGTSTNVEVNIFGGSVGNTFAAYSGSTVNISGGDIGDGLRANDGSAMYITGDEFHLNGSPIAGLGTPGDTLSINVQGTAALSGSLADGTPFLNSVHDGDRFADGTLTLVAATLPDLGPPEITLPADPAPRGLRGGQTLVVQPGGELGDDFNAGPGSTLDVTGGRVGRNFEAVEAEVTVAGGSVGDDFDAFNGSVVFISGGTVGEFFFAANGSVVHMSGGSVGSSFYASGSTVNIAGGSLNNDFEIFDGSTANITGGDISFGCDVGSDSVANISDGTIGGLFGVYGVANISGGAFDSPFDVHGGGVANISGGTFEGVIAFGGVTNITGGTFINNFWSINGSLVNISGGTFGTFQARDGSEVNLFGTQFVLDGTDITDSLATGMAVEVEDRDVILSGLLADGSAFEFNLDPDSSNEEYFDRTARLFITRVLPPLPGDTNGDGRISLADLNNVRNHFGDAGPADGTLTGDAYPFDGQVNIDDINAVLNNFGITTAAPVPEPEALACAAILFIASLLTVQGRT